MRRKHVWIDIGIAKLALGGFALATYISIQPVEKPFHHIQSDVRDMQIRDRNGDPLSAHYQDQWNTGDLVSLHQIPDTLKNAFIHSEDKRFYKHHGVDWLARFSALKQNLTGHTIRGASTITEQVVRIVHPRPRTLWSKWIEGFEAMRLENHTSKEDIFEFYLNQLPYASHRRGVRQAARFYFDRDLGTLSPREMLALVVLARAPSGYDPYRHPARITGPINTLAAQLFPDKSVRRNMTDGVIQLVPPRAPVNAMHAIQYIRTQFKGDTGIRTTLDAPLQDKMQDILDRRVQHLNAKNLYNGALLVADHTTGDILAWVNAGARGDREVPSWRMDAVTTPRQPGSALKPFLYARALDKGWTAATLIDDSPLAEAIGSGLHRFRNYSRHFYGPVPLRQALGNSLNIPALKTIRYVGVQDYFNTLHNLGFESLDRDSAVYDEGLALGNGEITLLEMVQGYATLANHGRMQPLHITNDPAPRPETRIFSPEAASLIGNILSDPAARADEFGSGSVLNLPIQTAVKTGTSTDYRDAWAVGYNDRYVVGVWMGNLDRTPTKGITGSLGPALVLRSAFAELNRGRDTHPLWLSPKLVRQDICLQTKGTSCLARTEYFLPGTAPDKTITLETAKHYEMVRPTHHLDIAYDPRIPAGSQSFRFELNHLEPGAVVDWIIDDVSLGASSSRYYLWPVRRGRYKLRAEVWKNNMLIKSLPEVVFRVK